MLPHVKILTSLLLVQCASALDLRPDDVHHPLVRRQNDNQTAGVESNQSPYASIVPSETLNWVPCTPPGLNSSDTVRPENSTNSTLPTRSFECARLLVSLSTQCFHSHLRLLRGIVAGPF